MAGALLQSLWWGESCSFPPHGTCSGHGFRGSHTQALESAEDSTCQKVSIKFPVVCYVGLCIWWWTCAFFRTASLDVEPVYTFRGHEGPVLALVVSPTGETCYSAGVDSIIRCWNLPSSNIDPYDSYDPNVLSDALAAHSDAVWGLSIHSSKTQLLSCSADGTVRLWSPGTKSPLLNTFRAEG